MYGRAGGRSRPPHERDQLIGSARGAASQRACLTIWTPMLTWTQIESAAVAAGWKRAGVEWRGPCPFCGGRDRAHVRPGSSANFIGSCRRCGADGIALARALVGDVGEAWTASNGPGRPALLRHSGLGGPGAPSLARATRRTRPISNRGDCRRPGRRRCDGCRRRRLGSGGSGRRSQRTRPARCVIASRRRTKTTRTRFKSRRSATTARGYCSPRKANAPPSRDRASSRARGCSWRGRAGRTWRCARA